MRYALVLLALFLIPSVTVAQPIETVLIDQRLILYPGATWTECVAVEHGVLTLEASSPPGRTGQTANLLFSPDRQDARPEVYLATPLGLDKIVASHLVEAGSYCYHVMVTGQEPPTVDPNDPMRPNKQVRLTVVHEAR